MGFLFFLVFMHIQIEFILTQPCSLLLSRLTVCHDSVSSYCVFLLMLCHHVSFFSFSCVFFPLLPHLFLITSLVCLCILPLFFSSWCSVAFPPVVTPIGMLGFWFCVSLRVRTLPFSCFFVLLTHFVFFLKSPGVRVGLKRENYGRGRWTQTQLPEARSGEQKASFIKKLITKTKADKTGQKAK